MQILFCADPLQSRQPDPVYAAEMVAAKAAGFEPVLLNFEALLEGRLTTALRSVAIQNEAQSALYRGWMLKPAQYERLYTALAERKLRLLNDPAAYTYCHYLPTSYPVFEGLTPRTVWMRLNEAHDLDFDAIMNLLKPFGARPIIVKDFVKSRKHEWLEACFIPQADDRATVERVVTNFVTRQGDDLNEGLVFREWIEFEPLARHSKSGMPITKEFRLFFLDSKLLYKAYYWDEGNYGDLNVPPNLFTEVAARVQSRFFTLDVAHTTTGDWLIVEPGDGQVAGLPEQTDVKAFYNRLAATL